MIWETSGNTAVSHEQGVYCAVGGAGTWNARENVKTLNGSSRKVGRAQMLLKADVAGPAWTDAQIAEAFDSRTRSVETLRKRFVTEGFEETLHGKQREKLVTEKILDGQREAQVIALRLGPPPKATPTGR